MEYGNKNVNYKDVEKDNSLRIRVEKEFKL